MARDRNGRPGNALLERLVPGGIVPTDHVHTGTRDDTCSRCRKAIDEHEVPLMFWSADGRNLLIYCEACTGAERE